MDKRVVRRVEAKTPTSMRAEACVTVELLIDTEGKVCCTYATGGHPLIKTAGEEAARQWLFEPLVRDGKHIGYVGTLSFSISTTPGKNACESRHETRAR